MSSSDTLPTPQNRLLAMLSSDIYGRLQPNLERVWLESKHLLYEAHTPIECVYFPINGVVSVLTLMENGTQIEVGTVGHEGFVGVPVFLGAGETAGRAFAQVPGEALRIRTEAFRQEMLRNGPFIQILHRYLDALFSDMAQQIACNRLHSVQQRCARWLLMTRDRVGANEFPLTQEFLAQMLGVLRAGVNEEAMTLQEKGILRYRRGVITILDAEGLEAVACECHKIVRSRYDQMLNKPFAD